MKWMTVVTCLLLVHANEEKCSHKNILDTVSMISKVRLADEYQFQFTSTLTSNLYNLSHFNYTVQLLYRSIISSQQRITPSICSPASEDSWLSWFRVENSTYTWPEEIWHCSTIYCVQIRLGSCKKNYIFYAYEIVKHEPVTNIRVKQEDSSSAAVTWSHSSRLCKSIFFVPCYKLAIVSQYGEEIDTHKNKCTTAKKAYFNNELQSFTRYNITITSKVIHKDDTTSHSWYNINSSLAKWSAPAFSSFVTEEDVPLANPRMTFGSFDRSVENGVIKYAVYWKNFPLIQRGAGIIQDILVTILTLSRHNPTRTSNHDLTILQNNLCDSNKKGSHKRTLETQVANIDLCNISSSVDSCQCIVVDSNKTSAEIFTVSKAVELLGKDYSHSSKYVYVQARTKRGTNIGLSVDPLVIVSDFQPIKQVHAETNMSHVFLSWSWKKNSLYTANYSSVTVYWKYENGVSVLDWVRFDFKNHSRLNLNVATLLNVNSSRTKELYKYSFAISVESESVIHNYTISSGMVFAKYLMDVTANKNEIDVAINSANLDTLVVLSAITIMFFGATIYLILQRLLNKKVEITLPPAINQDW